MNALFNNVNDVFTGIDDIIALATAYYNIGLQYVYPKHDDSKSAYRYFSTCMKLLEGKESDYKTILLHIGVLNEINSVYEKLFSKEHTYWLNKAVEEYLIYTTKDNYRDPIHIASLVDIKERESDPRTILDTLHHKTLQELGDRYRTRPKDKHLFVGCMNTLINNRVRYMVVNKRKFDDKCFDMALTIFDLSKYFLANSHFAIAKSYITMADCVIHKFVEDRLKTAEKKGTSSYQLPKNYMDARAVRDISWGFYGVSLLRFRMEKVSQNKESKSEIEDLILKVETKSEVPDLLFSVLEEQRITIEIAET
ncbi:uncharacterized protein LOC112461164, partial [Temnothorax curvispinosus]|uniref:Uncharacterized protein LOC112461164 n=1 Tax=Temnothorax curvispinosus TaxID=300111 RepID=A0A6J1QNF4_9HYME